MNKLALVILGGGLGAGLRYGVSLLLTSSKTSFPWSTLTVNLVGCFLIGLLYPILTKDSFAQPLLIIGLLGGFTTFSSFGLDGLKLIQQGALTQFATYFLISNIAGLFLVYIGTQVASTLQ